MTGIKTEDAQLAERIQALRADPRSYKYGLIYAQAEDPCVVLPKRYGLGWTVNFGHRYGLLFLAGFILTAAAPPLLVLGLGWAHSRTRGWMVFPFAPLLSVGSVVALARYFSNRPIGPRRPGSG